MKTWLPLTLVLLVFIGYVYFDQTRKSEPATVNVSDTVFIKGDSQPYFVYVKTPTPVSVDHFPDTGKMIVDTASIIAKHFERVSYRDTIRDTSVILILDENITENRINSRDVQIQNLRAQAVTYNTTTVSPSPQWLAGPSVSYFGGKLGIGASLAWVRKKDAMQLNISLVNRGAQFTYLFKIK
jgi:hypothetical protein